MNENIDSDLSQTVKNKFNYKSILLLILGVSVLVVLDFIISFVSALFFFCKGELTGCKSQGATYLFFIILALGIYLLYVLFRPKK